MGVLIPILISLFTRFFKKDSAPQDELSGSVQLGKVDTQNGTISNNNIVGSKNIAGTNSTINVYQSSAGEQIKDDERIPDNYRQRVVILFIDDDTKFQVVSILKKAGWVQTRIMKDLKSWNDTQLINAHIVFVDIQGVGKVLHFPDEGLGLAQSIKEKYPQKKLIIYSADSDGKRFHKAFRLADDQLSKNAVPYEFEVIIDTMAKQLISDGLL